jgi:uncharacterized protein (TIGR02118 family)
MNSAAGRKGGSMIKMIVAIYRKPGMTMEEFQDRWLNGHGPLVRTHAKAMRMKKYVQSHYVSASDFEEVFAARGWNNRPDGLTEIWWESFEDFRAAMATPEGAAGSAALEADERIFFDVDRTQAFITHEETIF